MPDGELSNHAASPACDSVCCQHGIGRPETFLDLWLVIYPNACPLGEVCGGVSTTANLLVTEHTSTFPCPEALGIVREFAILHHEKPRQASCWIKKARLHDGMRHLLQQLA